MSWSNPARRNLSAEGETERADICEKSKRMNFCWNGADRQSSALRRHKDATYVQRQSHLGDWRRASHLQAVRALHLSDGRLAALCLQQLARSG